MLLAHVQSSREMTHFHAFCQRNGLLGLARSLRLSRSWRKYVPICATWVLV